MDALVEIIKTFSAGEASEFTTFINRLKRKQNRKDLELFWLLYREDTLDKQSLLKRLYSDGNKVAYHALRKKLLRHVTDYIFSKQLREDYTSETQVSAYVGLARYLSEHNIDTLAWKYLRKAEQMAVKTEQYAMANQIARQQLDMPLHQLKQDIEPVLQRKKNYLQLAIEDDRADTAYKIIHYHLQQSKRDVEATDVQSVIEQILSEYELTGAVSRRPSMVYRLMSIARSAVKSSKSYYGFEPLLLQYYKGVELGDEPSDNDQLYMARLQYMIAHTLFRNKKFKQAHDYIYLLREQLRIVSKTEYTRLLPRFTQLYCALRFFSGHINEAIRMVDAAFMQKLRLKPEEVLNLKLNKAIYHFYNEDHKVALQELLPVEHSNAWCAKVAGIEWVVKKELLELFIQYELGNYDIASNKIRAMQRHKYSSGKLPQMERVLVFLNLINQIVDDPAVAQTRQFYDLVEGSFDWIPIEQEDLHASVYYAWMKSKIVDQKPYKVLLDLILIE
ncbi:hypothetical protein [Carboxylicivirga sp. RSCT41]|uniref:hypothetical protein n=1 Tax=Carboxylicivirga agarovorans TaxID=3417570 RepID=UPI003D334FD0